MINLCPPAIIYLIFSITQILIDLYNGAYNTVAMKTIVTIMVTLLLNILCQRGLNTISWIIVFIPLILMTVIVTLLLYIFGLNSTTGSLNYACQNNTPSSTSIDKNNINIDSSGNIIIYDPYYNSVTNPVYYQSPNIIIPKPPTTGSTTTIINRSPTRTTYIAPIPSSSSSSPVYQS